MLIAREEIGSHDDDGAIAYPESASFVGFLVDTFGREKFVAVYAALANSDDPEEVKGNLRVIHGVYGQSLTELERLWLDHLKANPAGEPGSKPTE